MQRACVGAVLEELQPLGRAHAGAVHKGLQLQGETHSEKGETCEEERVAETSCYKLSAIPIPHLLCHSGGEEEESGVKLSWEERGGWGNVLYVSLFLTVFPLLLIGNQLLIFPWSSCFCP